jgi:hypothetical protein
MRTQVFNLLVSEQHTILELLQEFGVPSVKEKIKEILDYELFEIISTSTYEVLKIRKKSTGEIFEKGCSFYSKKYQMWIDDKIYFDESLVGVYYGNEYYKNYVRCSSGIYHLDEISLTDKEIIIKPDEEYNCLFV